MALTEPLTDGISAGPMVAKLTDPLGASDGLLARTKTFRGRVKGENGSLEDDCLEGLYDPILRTVKGFSGVGLSDLVFFGAGSAVEINSGSIPKIFDASGDEHDATQTDTAKQPALDTNGIGGRYVGKFDGSEDVLSASNVYDGYPATILAVSHLNGVSSTNPIHTSSNNAMLLRAKDTPEWEAYSGSSITSGSPSEGDFYTSVVFDAPSSVLRVSGSEVVSGNTEGSKTPGRLDIGADIAGWQAFLNGSIGAMVVFRAALSTSQVTDLENNLTEYYSL
jgi:hypothetical protein